VSVLSEIRALPEAVRKLAASVHRVTGRLDTIIGLERENGPAEARLEELERSRARWEAEIEALVMKADGTLKAASNAESRSRTMIRHAEKLSDPFGEEGDGVGEDILPGDAPRGEAETVQPVHLAVAANSKEGRLRAKFNVGA